MWKSMQQYEILLASKSPRRAALLKELGIPFRVVGTAHQEESYPRNLDGAGIARYLAELKSDAWKGSLKDCQVLLTADTVVWYRDRELGKPSGAKEAIRMIGELSGQTHHVYTGVCLRSNRWRRAFTSVTEVTFSRLEAEEIGNYVARFRPFDKAGAYGIQEWIGYIAVEKIVGSYFNVMGLPVQRVYAELKECIIKDR